jgi:hypothetical protein
LEAREDVGVHVDDFKRWNGFFLDPEEMVIVIDNNVFAFFLIAGFHFVGHDFRFFVPKYRDLFFWEGGIGQECLSHIFGLGFAEGLFMALLFGLFQHDF